MGKDKISSAQFMLALFVSGCSVILLGNYGEQTGFSFLSGSAAVLAGLTITLLYFVPSVIIRKKTDLDFAGFARLASPFGVIFTASYYEIYFAFAINFFLIKYVDVFILTQSPQADEYVVACIMLGVCVYAAVKGISPTARCCVFIAAVSIISYILFFAGNIGNLDFAVNKIQFDLSESGLTSEVSFFMTGAVTSVLFACCAEKIKGFKLGHIAVALSGLAVLFVLFVIFVCFSLGKYGGQQQNQMYLLSKSAYLGIFGGADCLFLITVTVTVFLMISLSLIGALRFCKQPQSKFFSVAFPVICFMLFICAENFSFIKNVLVSQSVFNILTFISAVLIPCCYIFLCRRKLNV